MVMVAGSPVKSVDWVVRGWIFEAGQSWVRSSGPLLILCFTLVLTWRFGVLSGVLLRVWNWMCSDTSSKNGYSHGSLPRRDQQFGDQKSCIELPRKTYIHDDT
jgi:hypothetical protein